MSGIKHLCFLTFVFGFKAFALDPTHNEALSENSTQDPEQQLAQCMQESSPDASALLKLSDYEQKLDHLVDQMTESAASDPVALEKLAEESYSSYLEEAKRAGEKSMALAEVEGLRVLAEFRQKIAMAYMRNPNASGTQKMKTMQQKADMDLQRAFSKLKAMGSGRKEFPGLLERVTESRLNSAQFSLMLDKGTIEDDVALKKLRSVVADSRGISPSISETVGLDALELDAFLSQTSPRPGTEFARVNDPAAWDDFVDLIDRSQQNVSALSKNQDMDNQSLENMRQLEYAKLAAQFQSPSKKHREEAQKTLGEMVKSGDPQTKEIGDKLASQVFEMNQGCTTSQKIVDLMPPTDPLATQFQQTMDETGKNFDAQMAASIEDPEMRKKLRMPTYKELMSYPNGDLGLSYNKVLGGLTRMAYASEQYKKGEIDDEQFNMQMKYFEMDWMDMQCMQAYRGSVSTKDIKKSPMGGFSVNLNPCKADGKKTFDDVAMKSSMEVRNQAVDSNYHKELAWIGGEFAFDVVTTIGTGGAAFVVKKGVQVAAKKVGTKLLAKAATAQVTKSLAKTAVKVGVKTATYATQAVAVDFSNSTLNGAKSYLMMGLKEGDWNSSRLLPYAATGAAAARVATNEAAEGAIKVAAKGFSKLWSLSRSAPGIGLAAQMMTGKVMSSVGRGIAATSSVVAKNFPSIAAANKKFQIVKTFKDSGKGFIKGEIKDEIKIASSGVMGIESTLESGTDVDDVINFTNSQTEKKLGKTAGKQLVFIGRALQKQKLPSKITSSLMACIMRK